MNEVRETELFTKLCCALDGSEKDWIANVKLQLKNSISGKPLQFDWFCEKKFKGKRLFYVHGNNKVVLIAVGKKKEQQKIIDTVIANKEYYLSLLN